MKSFRTTVITIASSLLVVAAIVGVSSGQRGLVAADPAPAPPSAVNSNCGTGISADVCNCTSTDANGKVTKEKCTDPAAASQAQCNTNSCDIIAKYINPFITLLSAMVGIAVTISIVIGGIQYGSSAGDPQRVTAAKNRIRNSIIALLAFMFLYAFLQFLVPGGIFKAGS